MQIYSHTKQLIAIRQTVSLVNASDIISLSAFTSFTKDDRRLQTQRPTHRTAIALKVNLVIL